MERKALSYVLVQMDKQLEEALKRLEALKDRVKKLEGKKIKITREE